MTNNQIVKATEMFGDWLYAQPTPASEDVIDGPFGQIRVEMCWDADWDGDRYHDCSTVSICCRIDNEWVEVEDPDGWLDDFADEFRHEAEANEMGYWVRQTPARFRFR